jgi:hypothetical protein
MLEGMEKAGEIQMVERLSQEELNWVATVEQNDTQQQGQLRIFGSKMFCRSKYDTHKIKKMNRVKKSYTQMCAGRMSAQGGRKPVHKSRQQYTNIWAMNMIKIECCGNYGQLPTERTKQKL